MMFAGQMLLSAIAGITLIFAPRGGEAPVMLLPLTVEAEQGLPNMLSAPGTLIVSLAGWDGAYIIRKPHVDVFTALWEHGVLMLNASAPGCGPIAQGAGR